MCIDEARAIISAPIRRTTSPRGASRLRPVGSSPGGTWPRGEPASALDVDVGLRGSLAGTAERARGHSPAAAAAEPAA